MLVHQAALRLGRSTKELGMIRSRRLHYFIFAVSMKWDDDLTLANSPRACGVLQLAMYALHLTTGCTLYFRQIKRATVERYIKDVASFLSLFSEEDRDLRKEYATDTRNSPYLRAAYHEMDRWEKAPNRREPFVLEMLLYWEKCIADTQTPSLSLDATLLDWFEVGLFAGLCLTEWA